MNDIDVLRHFRESGALLEGHFRLSSGLHSSGYLQCALVLQHPARAEALGAGIADADTVPGAPTWCCRRRWAASSSGRKSAAALGVRAIFAERTDGTLALRRGFALSSDDRVLVVEDVLTTGGSTRETIAVAEAHGATVVGAASIMDRSDGAHGLAVPFAGLCPMDVPAYAEDACPLCQQGVPVTKPGSRR